MLKRMLIVATAVGVLATAGVAGAALQASSSVTWPVACPHMACVNKHLNQLNTRVTALEGRVAHLRIRNRAMVACLSEFPVTRYYGNSGYYGSDTNGDGNFDQNNYLGNFRFFDQTNVGDNVDHWFLKDNCSPAVFGRPPAP